MIYVLKMKTYHIDQILQVNKNLHPFESIITDAEVIMIDQYHAGQMIISGKSYHKDLKIIGGKVVSNWWRARGHSLSAEDIADILAAKPTYLVVGMGYAGFMEVPDALCQKLQGLDIKLIKEKTQEATHAFNHLVAQGFKVAGAFHLTC
jgi:hypothetical protein